MISVLGRIFRAALVATALLLTREVNAQSNAKVTVLEQGTTNLATESFTEATETRHLERIVNVPSRVTALSTNQVAIAVTNTAVRVLSDATACASGVLVRANPGNAGAVYVGASTVTTSNGLRLDPGDAVTVEPPDGNDCGDVYINGTAADGASVLAK